MSTGDIISEQIDYGASDLYLSQSVFDSVADGSLFMATLAAFDWLAWSDGLHPSHLNGRSLPSLLQHHHFK
jgi:hypothetical protein